MALHTVSAQPAPAAPLGCGHCGAPTAGAAFCCRGCEGAHTLIQGVGLKNFYSAYAASAGGRPAAVRATPVDDVTAFVVSAQGRHHLDLTVQGLVCGACVWLVETVLNRQPGVSARLNLSTRRLRVQWDGAPSRGTALAQQVADLGYAVSPYEPSAADAADQADERRLLRALAVAGFGAGNLMMISVALWTTGPADMGEGTRAFLHWVSALVALPVVAYAGQPFFASALGALRHGRANMDVPISLGVLLAMAVSLWQVARGGLHAYFDSAVMLVFFLLIGRYLDRRMRGRARDAATQLTTRLPRSAVVDDGQGTRTCPVSQVAVGAVVRVAVGERVPVDGVVVEGASSLDTSLMTGEAAPQAVTTGDTVYAGTLNTDAPLRVRVVRTADRTVAADMVRLMEQAEQRGARLVRLADALSSFYTPVVHAVAAATFVGTWALGVPLPDAVLRAAAVLLVTCPCALALAIPAVQVVTSGALMRKGIFLKSGDALERLAKVDTVVVDKTGTLTRGQPLLVPAPRPVEALIWAASLAVQSRHPLSKAVAQAYSGPLYPLQVTEHPGQGLSAHTPQGEVRLGRRDWCGALADDDGQLELWLRRPGAEPHRFTFTDPLRPDVRATLDTLRQRGLDVHLLSGDREGVVAPMARALGVLNWRSRLLPADKVAAVQALQARGRTVLMVGDGLNDAPALASADVSMAPTSGVDIAQHAADLVFWGDSLAPVATAQAAARTSRRLVWQNLVLALVYNTVAVPLAVAGFITPLLAAVAMSSSSVLVLLNALRARRL